MEIFSHISYSNQITLFRLLGSVTLLPLVIVYLLSYNVWAINIFVAAIFALLAITDFFDGYIARKFDEVSLIGKIIDPIADKFLLFSALISLLAIEKIGFWWVFLLLGREIFIMTLRHVAAEYNCTIPVIKVAKYKTTVQLLALFVVILYPYPSAFILDHPYWNSIMYGLLCIATGLSLWSAALYIQFFVDRMKLFLNEQD